VNPHHLRRRNAPDGVAGRQEAPTRRAAGRVASGRARCEPIHGEELNCPRAALVPGGRSPAFLPHRAAWRTQELKVLAEQAALSSPAAAAVRIIA